ncbi:hypothetical protein D3C73_668060 [compost metagenome]
MAIGQVGYFLQLVPLLRITFPAVRVAALAHGPFLIAAGIIAVIRPIGPAWSHGLQMGGDCFALLVQPVGNCQIYRLGAVKQPRLIIDFIILKVRAVLLEIIRQLLLCCFRQ